MLTMHATSRTARVRHGRPQERERPKGAQGEGDRMGDYVLGFQEIDQTQVAVVGGKGANLGELSRIEGIRVPAGFCVTADAFRRIMADSPSIDDQLDQLSGLSPDDSDAIRTLSAEVRRTIEGTAIPDDLAAAITRSVAVLGEQAAYAVRSSATAEDLPTASFAGQQDTYLNVVGTAVDPRHISRSWASLFTETGRDLPASERLRPPGGPHGRGRAADGVSRRRPASCSRPTPSRPIGRSVSVEATSASARPWSPAG